MTPFSLSGLLAGLSSAIFGVLVLLKSENKNIGRVWFLFALCVAVWGFGIAVIPFISDKDTALVAWRISYAFGANWIAAFFLHFVYVFCGLKRRWVVLAQYVVGVFFFVASLTPLLYPDVKWVFNSFYYCVAGPIYLPLSTWWVASVTYSHYELIKAYSTASPIKKQQIKYFFFATAVGFSGGVFAFLPPLGIEIYPWGNFTIFLYPLIMAYAILRYRLMDLRFLLKEITKYFLSTGLVSLFLALVFYLLTQQASIGLIVFSVCLVTPYLQKKCLGGIAMARVRSGIINDDKARSITSLADRIKEAGYKISDLANTVIGIIRDEYPVRSCAMFVFDHDSRSFVAEAHSGYVDRLIPPLPDGDSLIQFIKENKSYAVDKGFAEKKLPPHEYQIVQESMIKIRAEICAPLIVLDQVGGFIVFGEKSDGKPYFANEFSQIKSITDETATALRYVLAVSRAAKETIKHAHTLNQSLKPLGQGVEFLVRRARMNGTDARLEKVVVPLVEATLKKLGGFLNFLLQDSRIVDEALRDKYELLPIKIGVVVDDGLASYDISIKEKGINLSKELLDLERVQILGHDRDLKSVFEILVNNALRYTPIGGKLEVKGQVTDDKYRIEFTNEGDTIPEENLKDIFREGFQIKNGRQGTAGIGLSNAFKILKMHKGNIFAENSRNPVGVRFILDLPLVSVNLERGQISV